jgi:hypothetical protein
MPEFRLTLDMIAAECGAALAQRLANALPGIRVYIPEQPQEHHILVRMLGREAAERLAEKFGGDEITIRMGPHRGRRIRERVLALRADGMIVSAIALEVGISERRAYEILAGADDRQPDLFKRS